MYNFIASETYAKSKERIGLIDESPYLSTELLQVLEDSIKENSQIRNSHNVPASIKALKKKFMD